MLLVIGMKTIKSMKNYLIPSFCLLASTCFGADKTIIINEGTGYTANIVNDLNDNETLTLTIERDPTMEKTWYTLNSVRVSGKTDIQLILTAKDGALNNENLEYLAECLWSVGGNIVVLKQLNISNNNLSTGNTFSDYLSSCSGLEVINISKNKSSFCSILLDKLISKSIKTIEASECGLKARNFEKILNLNTEITTLNLSNNKFDGLTDKFAAGLQKNAITTKIDLSQNSDLFKNPRSAAQLLDGTNGKNAAVTLTKADCSVFMQNWLKSVNNKITFN